MEDRAYVSTYIYRTRQGHNRIQLPREIEFEDNDFIGFRRNEDMFEVLLFNDLQFKIMSADEKRSWRPRKVHIASNKYPWALIPFGHLGIDPREGYVYCRFYFTTVPKYYVLEFVKPEYIMVQDTKEYNQKWRKEKEKEKEEKKEEVVKDSEPYEESNITW